MNFNEIVCPVSNINVDSNVSRVTSFNVVILLGLYILTSSPYFLIVIVTDYLIRAFLKQKYSPLRWIALVIVKTLKLDKKEINEAPKIFASRLGFMCALASLAFFYVGMPVTSVVIASILFALTVMDSVFNFCAGCLIYHTFVYPFFNK